MPLFGPPNIEKLKEKRDANGLIKALSHKDWKVRRDTAEALGELGDVRAVEPLIAALKDQDWRVSTSVADALGKLGDERAVEPLSAVLGFQNSGLHLSAMGALRRIGGREAEETLAAYRIILIGNLDGLTHLDKDADTCRRVVQALGQLGAIKALVDALQRRDNWRVRAFAAEALGSCEDRSAVEPLIAALGDQSDSVRMSAAEALAALGDARAVEPLIAALNDPMVRERAVVALGALRDPRAAQPLMAVLKDSNAYVRKRAAEALERIGGPEAEQALAEYRARQQ